MLPLQSAVNVTLPYDRDRFETAPGHMKIRSLLAVTGVMAVALAACADHGHGRRPGAAAANRQQPASALLFSPNGEPLTGGPLGTRSCPVVIGQWFARVDGNHDGKLERTEFMADANIQFERMDLDHDGFITSAELATFRAQFTDGGGVTDGGRAQDQPRSRPSGDGNAGSSPRHHSRHNDGGGSGGPDPRPPSSALGVGVADPVMSADTNLDFEVSLAEFLKQAGDTFERLDHDHDGVLSPDEAKSSCPAGSS